VAGGVFVDSSGWIALVSARDRRHADAERAVRDALRSRTRLFTTNLVLAEVHRWLLFRASAPAARAALARIGRSDSLEVVFATSDDHAAALAWLERFPDQAISYTDAASFAVMRGRRCEVALTFDRDFTIAGFRRTPDVV
jgi:predicted nucleic acid-binding protein